MPRDIIQIDNMLFVAPTLTKGGPGSGNFGHSGGAGGAGNPGGSGGGGGGGAGFKFDEDGLPVLNAKDTRLIERATEENANNFTAAEQRRISQIIQAQPRLKQDMTAYRGIDPDADGRFSGEKWKEQRFQSVTTQKEVAQRYARQRSAWDGQVVRVKIPKGTRVLNYSNYGYWGQGEILLDAGASFVADSDNHWTVKG